MMRYKGYIGKVEVDTEANVLHGEVLGIRDVVTFEGRTPSEAAKAFRESIDDYLELCKQRGEQAEKPFSGKFIVRATPALHRLISALADAEGVSLNAWVNRQLSKEIDMELARHHTPRRVWRRKNGKRLRK